MNQESKAPNTRIITTVPEIMKLWNPEWDIVENIDTSSELLPTLQKESDRLQGPWGMSYEIAKKTFEYLDYLKTKVYVVVIDKKEFTSYILFSPKGEPAHLLPYTKNLNRSLPWDEQRKRKIRETEWKFMSCIFQDINEKPDNDPSKHSYLTYFVQVFSHLREMKKQSFLRDGMYLFSLKDALIIRKDGKHPWIDIVGTLSSPKIPKQFLPLFNSTGGKDYWDIPIPTFDDMDFLYGIPEKYQNLSTTLSEKIPKAFFRGSASGCGYTVESNPRIRLAKMALTSPQYLDAGITAYGNKYKFYRGLGVGFIDLLKKNKIPYGIKIYDDKIPYAPKIYDVETKSKYRYTIEIEGNVAAHRVATDLLFGTVPLMIDTEFDLWFSHLLVPYQHYLPIKKDLSNLIEMIEWGNQNLDICQKIAINARNFALEILQRDVLLNIMANYFFNVKIET